MFLRLLILLTVVPLMELMLLLRIAEWTGWRATVILVIFTGVLGAWLARREGLKTVGRIQSELAAGRAPADALVDGVMILIAGAVLVTPGVITDLCGFALLVPPIRKWVKQRCIKTFKKRIVTMHHAESDVFVDVTATSRDAAERLNGLEDE